MVIKKYTANNMNEALTRIRYELGKNAVIISQRKIRKPGIAGFFSGKIVEVTAAVENSSMKKETPSFSNMERQSNINSSIENLKKVMAKEIEAKNNQSRNNIGQKEQKEQNNIKRSVLI